MISDNTLIQNGFSRSESEIWRKDIEHPFIPKCHILVAELITLWGRDVYNVPDTDICLAMLAPSQDNLLKLLKWLEI